MKCYGATVHDTARRWGCWPSRLESSRVSSPRLANADVPGASSAPQNRRSRSRRHRKDRHRKIIGYFHRHLFSVKIVSAHVGDCLAKLQNISELLSKSFSKTFSKTDIQTQPADSKLWGFSRDIALESFKVCATELKQTYWHTLTYTLVAPNCKDRSCLHPPSIWSETYVSYVRQAKGNHMTTASARGYRKKGTYSQEHRVLLHQCVQCVNLGSFVMRYMQCPSHHGHRGRRQYGYRYKRLSLKHCEFSERSLESTVSVQ